MFRVHFDSFFLTLCPPKRACGKLSHKKMSLPSAIETKVIGDSHKLTQYLS